VNNEAYQLELGGTSVNSTTFYRENEEPDGSDIVDITRKPDNSGWTGDGLDYDYADGSFPICWPEPIGPCSTAMQRYLWEMDGQSMYWRRESSDYGQTTNARLRVAFTGGSGIGVQYLVGRHSNDRFYIALDGGDVIFGNGVNPAQSPTTVDLSEINLAELVADGTDVKWYINNVLIATQAQSWTGLLDDVGFGVRGEQQSDFYSGSIYAVAVETDSENDVYTLDGNGPTEFPIGSTNSSAKLTRENNELDGSDIITINRQPDNSGWTGGGTVYDYATGARRDLGAYSAEYSESYGA
jgi:hypothetical protein